MSLGSLWVPPEPGMMPRLISGQPIFASFAAILRSQARASSQPPPKTKPKTAAIVGLLDAGDLIEAPSRDPSEGVIVGYRLSGHFLHIEACGKYFLACRRQYDGPTESSFSSSQKAS